MTSSLAGIHSPRHAVQIVCLRSPFPSRTRRARVGFWLSRPRGNEPIGRIRAYLDGSSIPSGAEYDVMAHCVNERLLELGVVTPLPYADELGL